MNIKQYIKKHKWHLMGIWKEPFLLEGLVCREIVSPRFKSVFSCSPTSYFHVDHYQLLPEKDFLENVMEAENIFEKDIDGTKIKMRKSCYQSISLLSSFKLSRLSSKTLGSVLKATSRMPRHWYEIMIADCALQNLCPKFLSENFTINGRRFTSESLLAKAALPKKLFPIIQEHYDLLEIAKKLKDGKSVGKDLSKHVKNYSWMNSLCWWGEPFSRYHYLEQAEKLAKKKPNQLLQKEIQSRKKQYKEAEKLIAGLKENYPLAYKYIDAIRVLADLKEENWDAVSKLGLRIRPYFKELAGQYNLSVNQLIMLTSDEIMLLSKGKLRPDIKKLNKRLSHVAVHAGKKIGFGIIEGEKVKKLFNLMTEKPKKVDKFEGTVIWQGKVKGYVSILNNIDELSKMKKGSILVCPMTDPDYMPAIRQAKAIVTDQGGLLCHAAIIARELRIPCVVGTEVATRILKDGDKVEVDATKGVVKKI